ncbi:2-oxo acid dehydrogenase subunit E2 [Spiroplasma endosymbiont of Stenodema calcarata]|uniref:2-oxo acid dehydrogenase subunit E2 n=1 Tax=Spiroplasma endosymbiont of Stenodema calcarata TaxID=3139328 RepID=UPI003CCACE9E
MEKIKVANLYKKGILKGFLYQDAAVKAGDAIALIESDSGEIIVEAPMDGIIVKPIKPNSKIKNNAVIAHLLTTESEIEKYYFKQLDNDEFSHLDKKGVVFSTTKNGEFGTKWKDVEEDNFSGADFVDPNKLNPTFTPPLVQEQSQNNYESIPNENVYNTPNIDSGAVLIDEQLIPNGNVFQDFEQNNFNQPWSEGMISNPNLDGNNFIQPQYNMNQQQQTFFPDSVATVQSESVLKEKPISQDKPVPSKRWDETELTFGPKKSRTLSFKELRIDDDHIINNRAKIPSIDVIKQSPSQNMQTWGENTMVNIPNSNQNNIKENTFNSTVNSFDPNSQTTNHNVITNAVPIGQQKLVEENYAKEYAKYLVNETKQQDINPANAGSFLGGQTEDNDFRSLVNKRRQQLHSKNDFYELSLENDNSKSAMDFLDENGRPKILRNIVQGRMNDLIKRNARPEMLSDYNSGISNYDYDQSGYNVNNDDAADEVYISADGYEIDPKNSEQSGSKPQGYFSPLKSYRDRLYEKLNDGGQREKILKTRNQRELIKKRMEEIAKGNVEVDSVLGEVNNYRRPSFEEIESQYEKLDNEYYDSKKQFQNRSLSNSQEEFNSRNKNQSSDGTLNQDNNQRKDNVTPITNNFQVPSGQPSASDNKVMVELAVLKEKISNQEQNNRQNELLHEIKSLREANHNNNNNNSNNLDKMMQYMLMQQMLKTMNASDPISKEMLKEFNFNNKQSFNQENENNSNANNLQVKKFDNDLKGIPNTYGNLVQPLNNNLNIVNTNSNVEPQGLETREEIKATRYPAIQSMIMSQTHVPPLTINVEIDMSSIIDQQRKLKNANTEYGVRFSTMSFLVKAVSLALSEYPKLNSYYDPKTNQIVIKNSQHIGLATETSEGLVIPVIKFAERMSLKQIAINIQETIERLRQGELYDYELQGSTITIANYGTVGAVNATPTIFYPNSAVIGIGRIARKPVVIKGDKLVIRSMMNIALTVDQRIIDAAEAGIFLTRLKEILESPELITLS